MPVAMEMVLLLLFGGAWVQAMETGSPEDTTALGENITEALKPSPVPSDPEITVGSPGGSILTPPSFIPSEKVTPLGTPIGASTVPESTTFQEVSTEMSSMFLETSNTNSDPAVPMTVNSLRLHTGTDGTVTTSSLEIFSETSGPSVTMATSGSLVTMTTSSVETFDATSGPPVTMEPFSETRPPVTMATPSLKTYSETSGHPVTMATPSLETSSETRGPPVTMATPSLETSSGRRGSPVTVTPGPPETRTTGSPISGVKIPTMATSEASVASGSSVSPSSGQGMNGSLLVAVLVALVVVVVLVVLLLLWRRRQKRHTGTLNLNRAGKRNGVVDAWEGPTRVPDEEAVTAAAGEPGGGKGAGVPETERTGQRPTLTTFFGRRKSRQGSLAMEELEAGAVREEEPLMGQKQEAGVPLSASD
ncbi:leukosialin [Dasypus novemcinctus]|uniref:leukosialin n=1 Tax=Dasypus novemcinctus TaxID=9361 RepID=UPI00265D688F|nr:leukosialin [Dasypus novemcinctus]